MEPRRGMRLTHSCACPELRTSRDNDAGIARKALRRPPRVLPSVLLVSGGAVQRVHGGGFVVMLIERNLLLHHHDEEPSG